MGEYFRLNKKQMDAIIIEVIEVTKNWKTLAKEIGIPRSVIELMTKAFNN